VEYIPRALESPLRAALARGKSVFLLGPRQTGKSTLLDRLDAELRISLVAPETRLRYEKEASLLSGEVGGLRAGSSRRLPLVLLDEVQKVPAILDVVQDLIDRRVAQFVLTGSSARKLRRTPGANLLPGRVVALRLDSLTYAEYPDLSLEDRLLYGTLPGLVAVDRKEDRETDLASYVFTYLEEEVRAEAIVRNLGHFARFLELAASESGRIVNYRKLSQEIGIAHTTVAAYYDILEDCLVAERVAPLTRSRTRKKLTRSSKCLFFDLGVRRLAAKEGSRLPRETVGFLFEQYVGLELIRAGRLSAAPRSIRFWRDPGGPEVDWVVEAGDRLVPVEAKWTDSPRLGDVKHLRPFLDEYRNADRGFLVCRAPRRVALGKKVVAIPWQEIGEI
jgi:predicted AAA+ superfamily ATPase